MDEMPGFLPGKCLKNLNSHFHCLGKSFSFMITVHNFYLSRFPNLFQSIARNADYRLERCIHYTVYNVQSLWIGHGLCLTLTAVDFFYIMILNLYE
jgi:hypothetical protein